jgi:methyl-accepting chemotaxis protein
LAIGMAAIVVLVFFLSRALNELAGTLRAYRLLTGDIEGKVIRILDNSSRISANVEEITRQVTIQATRVDRMTGDASEMVEQVKKTVDLYNRTIAKPAVMAASMASGLKGAASVLFGKR